MAYIGLRPTTQTLATASQLLSGDGSTLSFALQQAVGKASDIVVSVGREIQIPEGDYTASGTTLLFAPGRAPANASNNIAVTFTAGALNTYYVTANAYPAGTTTAPSIYATGAATTGVYWPTTTSLGLTVSGNTRVTVSDAALGVASSTTTGALRVTGGVGITGAAYIGGQLNLTSGLNATNETDGALAVTGGLGATGDFFLGGTMTIAGGLTVAGAFNTTSTNSLTVNTPFVFLANTNVGDAIDQGIVGTYNDGFTQRYTGFYRAQSDGAWKLFKNLTNQPTTLVDSANVSFQYADLWMGNANVTSTVQSTSTLTGALTTLGGMGVGKNLYIGGGIGAGGSLGSNGQFLQSTGSGLTWTTLSASKINQDASNVTVTTNYVNVAVNGSNVFSFGAAAISTAVYLNSTGNISAPQVNTGQIVAGQLNTTGNVLSTGGIFNALTVNGNITVTSAYAVPSANAASSLGTSATRWNYIYGVFGNFLSVNANYADLAEKYLADNIYEPGTVLQFGGDAEVTLAETNTTKVAGVVSTNPAYLMNSLLDGDNTVSLALTGRVPCKVLGPITKGDMLVSAGGGRARAEADPKLGTVIGKALENFNDAEGVIEVVVGRL